MQRLCVGVWRRALRGFDVIRAVIGQQQSVVVGESGCSTLAVSRAGVRSAKGTHKQSLWASA